MYVTAELLQGGGRKLSAGVKFKPHVYAVSSEHVAFVGERLVVVAGPHKDYPDDDVYTVELLSPPPGLKGPFFNAEHESCWESFKIQVE